MTREELKKAEEQRQERRDKINAINGDVYNKNQILKGVFKALRKGKEPIYARLNVADTDSAEEGVSEYYLNSGKGYKGYCYTIKQHEANHRMTYSNYDIYIFFGSNHFEGVGGGVGVFIIDALIKAGLKFEWNTSARSAIKIPTISAKKRNGTF